MRRIAALLAFTIAACAQATPSYDLRAAQVADGIYVFGGRLENFSRENGGNIVNTGFIVGDDGIIVIDSGPSRLYGEQQRDAIARVSRLPVARVFVTHAHPDHFLGNQAYPDTVLAGLPASNAAIRANGEALADNLYRLVGGWMIGTRAVVPTLAASGGTMRLGGRNLRLIASAGHTDGDLAIYDEKTKTLFAGDLVFAERAPTTPNADLPRWLAALDEIDRIDFRTIVPGHGPVAHDHAPVSETRAYLNWLLTTLRNAANRGFDINEVARLPVPDRFARWAVVEGEYARSIAHLYPKLEIESLPALNPPR